MRTPRTSCRSALGSIHAIVLLFAVALTVVGLPRAAAAADVDLESAQAETLEAIDSALVAVAEELVYAEMAGLLGAPSPPRVVALGATLELGSLSDDGVAARFLEVDETFGPMALGELISHGLIISPAVRAVLESGTIATGDSVNFEVYVVAYRDLIGLRGRQSGSAQMPVDDFADLLPIPLPPRTTAGPPPAQLLQADTEGLGRTVVVPQDVTTSRLPLDTAELGIYGAVLAIVLGLVAVGLISRRRARRQWSEPSSEDILDVGRAVNSCVTVEQLCLEVAQHSMSLVGATGALVTIDGHEGLSGDPVSVPRELVMRANRDRRFVVNQTITAVPLVVSSRVVGLIAVEGGNGRTLEALGPLVEQAYRSITVHQETAALVFVDDLTGIANRRRFDSDLKAMMDKASHERTPVSIAMFDVDHFKSFNDNNGHIAGDEALRSIAELIANNLRTSDVVYRYGGEEFVALLPGADVDDAYQVVERIREVVEQTEFEGEATQPSGCVTLSVGIAAAPLDESTNLVHAADMALYEAKMSGRNRVVIEASLT